MDISVLDNQLVQTPSNSNLGDCTSIIPIKVIDSPTTSKSPNTVIEKPNSNLFDPLNLSGSLFLDGIKLPEIDCAVFLPPWINDYASVIAEQNNIPKFEATMLCLTFLASSFQRKYVVTLDKDSGHIVPLNLLALIISSATQHKALLDALSKPFINWEKAQIEKQGCDGETLTRFNKALANGFIRKAVKIEIDALTKERVWRSASSTQATIQSENEKIQSLLHEASKAKNKIPKFIEQPKKIIANDITRKSFPMELLHGDGKVSIISNDDDIFKILDSHIFKQSIDGGSLKIKTENNQYAFLDNISVTVGLITQYQNFEQKRDKSKAIIGNGQLFPEFLYCLSTPGITNHSIFLKTKILEIAKLAYEAGIEFLLNFHPSPILEENTNQYLLGIFYPSNEALDSWITFAQSIDFELADDSKPELLLKWLQNLPDIALKIAGLIHFSKLVQEFLDLKETDPLSPLSPFSHQNWNENLILSKEAMELSIELCKKLITHAKASYQLINKEEKNIADLKYAFNWLLTHMEKDDRNGDYFIRQNGLHRSIRFRKSKVRRVIAVLDVFSKHNILSRQCKLPTRKPTYIRYVNPEFVKYLNEHPNLVRNS